MKTIYIVADWGIRVDALSISGDKRARLTVVDLYNQGLLKGDFRTDDPIKIRELRKAFQQRESELVEAGFLEVE